MKLSNFIPLKIRKRGGGKVVVRPDGQLDAPGKVGNQFDQLSATGIFEPLEDRRIRSSA